MSTSNPNSIARDFAVQFLYQCEADKLFYFSNEHFENFVVYFKVESAQKSYLESICRGVLENLNKLDELISEHSKNWKISRMASTDRVALRMATYEFIEKLAPDKVILNEAIELAKRYGTDQSSSFVNGILDALLTSLRS